MNTILKSLFIITAISLVACSSSKNTGSQSKKKNASSGKHEMLDDNTFKLTEVSDDETYGYTSGNPIKVGGPDALSGGPANERRYLNALLGPNGESIMYERRGSCCQVKSEYGLMGYALLDIYDLKFNDTDKPIALYINMYDPGELKAPKGFTFKK